MTGAIARLNDFRLPDGQTVVDRFVAERPDRTAADREMLLGWRDPVEDARDPRPGRRRDRPPWRTCSTTWSTGRTPTWAGPRSGRCPGPDSCTLGSCPAARRPARGWSPGTIVELLRKSDAGWLAKVALELATTRPELVFRNPEKVEQGWRQMREDRAGFVAFFGGDELVLPPAEAEERLNAYYRHRQEAALARRPAQRSHPNLPGLDVPTFEFPPDLRKAGTVGIIFDDVDGPTMRRASGSTPRSGRTLARMELLASNAPT